MKTGFWAGYIYLKIETDFLKNFCLYHNHAENGYITIRVYNLTTINHDYNPQNHICDSIFYCVANLLE